MRGGQESIGGGSIEVVDRNFMSVNNASVFYLSFRMYVLLIVSRRTFPTMPRGPFKRYMGVTFTLGPGIVPEDKPTGAATRRLPEDVPI